MIKFVGRNTNVPVMNILHGIAVTVTMMDTTTTLDVQENRAWSLRNGGQ